MRDHDQSVLPESGESRRVYLLLRDDITNGRYADGDAPPGEQRLADRHGGARIAGADQSVSTALAAPDVAEALGVSTGSPLLALIRVMRGAADEGVEQLCAVYRPDMSRLENLPPVGRDGARHWAPVTRGEA